MLEIELPQEKRILLWAIGRDIIILSVIKILFSADLPVKAIYLGMGIRFSVMLREL